MLNKWHLHIIGHACHRTVKQRIHWIHRCTHSGRIIFASNKKSGKSTTMLLPLCTLWQNPRQGANKKEREKERLSISPPTAPSRLGLHFQSTLGLAIGCLQPPRKNFIGCRGHGRLLSALLFTIQKHCG